MKVARLYDFLDVRIEEAPVPPIGPGEALVRARACGICSGDVVPWYIRKKAPLVFGHEPVGEIVEVGDGVEPISTRAIASSSTTMRPASAAGPVRAVSSSSVRRWKQLAASIRAAWRSTSASRRSI